MIKVEEKKKYDFENCVTAQDYNGPYMDEDLIAAAYETGGNFTKMAQLLKRSRTGTYNASMARIEVVQALEEIKQMKLDQIEENQWNLAATDKQAGQYMLDRQAKDRGFVTRQETTGKDGGPVTNATIVKEAKDDMSAAEAYKELMGG